MGEPSSPVSPATTIQSPVSPTKGKAAKGKSPAKPPAKPPVNGGNPLSSITSLPLPTEQKAESARSYLKTLPGAKEKVKSRPDGGNSIFSGFKNMMANDEQDGEMKKTSTGLSTFNRLGTKMMDHARKVFGIGVEERKASLRWDKFVQVRKSYVRSSFY